jgi:hypothetical protein
MSISEMRAPGAALEGEAMVSVMGQSRAAEAPFDYARGHGRREGRRNEKRRRDHARRRFRRSKVR